MLHSNLSDFDKARMLDSWGVLWLNFPFRTSNKFEAHDWLGFEDRLVHYLKAYKGAGKTKYLSSLFKVGMLKSHKTHKTRKIQNVNTEKDDCLSSRIQRRLHRGLLHPCRNSIKCEKQRLQKKRAKILSFRNRYHERKCE